MNNNNQNPYFGNDPRFETEKTGIYGWVWVLAVIGVIITVIESYFTALFNTEFIKQYRALLEESVIEDENGSENSSLAVLTFRNFLYYFDDNSALAAHNKFDSDCTVLSYNSTVQTRNGIFRNDFSELPINYRVKFTEMSYYDISCVYITEEEGGNDVNITFSSQVKSGNLEAILFSMPKNYTGSTSEEGIFVIDDNCFTPVAHFDANSTDSEEYHFEADRYYILAVGAENASGEYSVNITKK